MRQLFQAQGLVVVTPAGDPERVYFGSRMMLAPVSLSRSEARRMAEALSAWAGPEPKTAEPSETCPVCKRLSGIHALGCQAAEQ